MLILQKQRTGTIGLH